MIIYIRRQQTGEEHAVVAQHNPWFDWSSIRGGSGNATTCCLGAGEYSTACTRHKYTHIDTHSVGVIRIWRLAAQCNLSANHEENKRLSRAAGLIDALSTLLLSTDDDAVRVCFRLHVCNCLCVQCFLVLVFRPHKYCIRLGNLSHARLLAIVLAHVAHTYMRKHTFCTSFASNIHSAHAHTPWPSLPFSFHSSPHLKHNRVPQQVACTIWWRRQIEKARNSELFEFRFRDFLNFLSRADLSIFWQCSSVAVWLKLWEQFPSLKI